MTQTSRIGLISFVILIAGGVAPAILREPATQPSAPAVDFRKLKEICPEQLNGMKRTSHEGQRTKMGEFAISTAQAAYESDSDKDNAPRISLEILDYGATPGMAQGMAAWAQLDIDRESDTGYEKSTRVKGQPALETYDTGAKSGRVQVFVAGRFIVTLELSNLPPEQTQKVAEELPLEKLAGMK
ncbi:MAG: hypothetical protein ACREJC_21755 [Tepidisphaeraceae bacterium]